MSDNFELKLRKRKVDLSGSGITLPLTQARAFVQLGEGHKLLEMLKNALDGVDETIHDLRWLIRIIDWIPTSGDGINQRQRARWLQLIHKINELEDDSGNFEKEFSIQITDRWDKLIWNRIKDERFVAPVSRPWDMFLYDYIEASGRKVEELYG